ncbi:hypothetical protein SUGI_0003800 [Cryptomeria japonica]|nr:hypothetical protein SUGI_0003800 [Cryptomeria japonica]
MGVGVGLRAGVQWGCHICSVSSHHLQVAKRLQHGRMSNRGSNPNSTYLMAGPISFPHHLSYCHTRKTTKLHGEHCSPVLVSFSDSRKFSD